MTERFEITVDQNGAVRGDVIGGQGKSCDKFKSIENALGDADITYLPEYEQEVQVAIEAPQQQKQTL